MTDNAIIDTTKEQTPQEVMTMVNRVADATKALVGNAIINLQGKKYIKVEGWQAIAAAHGCTVTADTVTEQTSGAVIAVAFVRRLRDGAQLGQAEGYVGMDEVWGKRPMYARRAMAQTRAISRACRNAFAHVVVAMNTAHGTGLETTPAEEVPEGGFDRKTDTKGNVHTKMPEWNAEQKAEAGGYTTDILRLLENMYPKPEDRAHPLALLNKFRNDHKYDAPADVIDALAKWKSDLEDTIVVEGA